LSRPRAAELSAEAEEAERERAAAVDVALRRPVKDREHKLLRQDKPLLQAKFLPYPLVDKDNLQQRLLRRRRQAMARAA
jgi:hypothetical protein